MATLTGELISETYDSLLKVTDNNTITGVKKRITDGFGNEIPLQLSSTDIEIDGTLILSALTDLEVATKFLSLKADNSVAYRTASEVLSDIGGASSSSIFGTTGNIAKFTSTGAVGDSILEEIGNAIHLTDAGSSFASFGIINPGVDNDCYIGSTINNDFIIRVNNTEALRIDTALRLKIANIQNALYDTDKFLVSEDGVIKYRTGAEVLADIGGASAAGFVPYTGATANLALGEYGYSGGFLTLDTTPTGTPASQGTMYWDDSRSTVALIMNGTLQHIGQDSFFYVKNSTGSNIPKGTAVRFAGTNGASGHVLIAPMLADGTYPSTYYMGITSEAIGNGEFGQVMAFGELGGIDTDIYTAGALLYVSTTVAGAFQTTAPLAPNNIILAAATINSKTNGDIIVRATIGSNINNDEGVKIVSGVTGDLLQLQASGLWENKSVASLGLVPQSRTLSINGTSYDLSANRSWSVGTVTSVSALTLGTSGTDLNSTVANSTTTPVITLNVPDASVAARGVITTGAQTIAGSKTFSVDAVVNGINIGRGGGNEESNTRVGKNALIANTTGIQNTANGYFSLFSNTTGYNNTAFGHASGDNNTTGYNNIFVGMNSNGESATESNRTWIGNTSTTSTWLGGNLLLGSRTNATSDKLQITGGAKITGIITLGTGADSYVYDSGGSLILQTGASPRLTINPSGNLGLGVTPSAWSAGVYAMDFGSGTAILNPGSAAQTWYLTNAYHNAGFKYKNSGDEASWYQQVGGTHAWHTAPSGTAGNAITFTQAMTLGANGNVLIGTTTDAGYKLDVNGTSRVSGAATFSSTIRSNDTYGFTIGSVANVRRIQYGSDIATSFTFLTDTNGYAGIYAGAATFSSSVTATAFNVGTGTFNFSSGDALLDYSSANVRLRTFKVGTGYITPLLIDSQTGAATFSSSVSATILYPSTGIQFYWGSGNRGGIYAQSTIAGGATNYSTAMFAETGYGLNFWVDGGVSKGFQIATTGAATFSSLGTGTVYSNGGTLTNTNPSDKNLKTEIQDLSYGLNEIMQLRPVSYLWKDDKINQGKQFGFIAQEVQEVMPDLVKEGDYLGLDKEAIFVTLINAIQELKAEIELLKNK